MLESNNKKKPTKKQAIKNFELKTLKSSMKNY